MLVTPGNERVELKNDTFTIIIFFEFNVSLHHKGNFHCSNIKETRFVYHLTKYLSKMPMLS